MTHEWKNNGLHVYLCLAVLGKVLTEIPIVLTIWYSCPELRRDRE